MITESEIRTKALRYFPKYCRELLNGECQFPYVITGNRQPSSDPSEFDKQMQNLYRGAKGHNNNKYGYSIDVEKTKRKSFGYIYIPKKIYFCSSEDYEHYISKVSVVLRIKEVHSYIEQNSPWLNAWFISKIAMILKSNFLDYYVSYIDLATWFRTTPIENRCVLYRNIPVKTIDSKFIERNERIVKEILDFILPESEISREEKDFSLRYGLETIDTTCFFIRHISYTDTVCKQLHPVLVRNINDFHCNEEIVVMIENKATFLSLPHLDNAIAIWGCGRAVSLLKDAGWLSKKEIYYWGDCDQGGYGCLSDFRRYFPKTKSLFMDMKTFDRYNSYVKKSPQKYDNNIPEFLTPREIEVFNICRNQHIMLEQECISLNDIEETFVKIQYNTH